jgi:hypothetical protein
MKLAGERLPSMGSRSPGPLVNTCTTNPQHAAKTLFATHYHEMTELGKLLPECGTTRWR